MAASRSARLTGIAGVVWSWLFVRRKARKRPCIKPGHQIRSKHQSRANCDIYITTELRPCTSYFTMPLKQISNYPELYKTCMTYPAIDNHAHPLLKIEHRNDMAYENIWSDADSQSPALCDSVHTLACYKATAQLASVLGMPSNINDLTWEQVRAAARGMDYDELCKACFGSARIQCVLFDDGLGGVSELAEGYRWHDRYTTSPNKRIVRIEVVAEVPNPTALSLPKCDG